MNRPEFLPALSDEMLPFPHSDEVCIGEIVCRDLLECGPAVPLHEAARRMSERRVSSILVVEDDVVLGIWTERDALAVDFDDPATFRLGRRGAKEHLAFGRGIHTCPGAALARTETRISLERMLARLDDIRLDPEHHGPEGERRFAYLPTYVFRALKELHLRFIPGTAAQHYDRLPVTKEEWDEACGDTAEDAEDADHR